jgi:hypothetical protein
MRPPPVPPKDPLGCAAVEALRAARWECAELLSRRPSLLAADLLRAHAAELATSALASDQVLSLALETAARNLELGTAPVDEADLFLAAEASGAAEDRERLRTLVLQQSPAPSSVDVVGDLERRLADHRLTPAGLSRRLAAEANLQQALWDDPRIPAGIAVRLAMLRSIPKLAQRASDLEGDPTAACRNVTPRAASPAGPAAFGTRRAKSSTASSASRWSSQKTGWLLLIGLLVFALIATVAPIGMAPPN